MKFAVSDAPVDIESIWQEYVHDRESALRDKLIMHYIHLVRFVVGRLGIPTTSTMDSEDLLSYGVIGLINAIDRFEPDRGIKFEAYATTRIRGAVIDQLRALNWMPRSAVTRSRQIERVLADLEQRLGRPAHEDEMAAECGVTIERYRQMLLDAGTSILSLDAPLSTLRADDDSSSLGELLEDVSSPSPTDAVEQQEMQKLLSQAISRIPIREQQLLALYYVEELTMKEISQVMHVSESRVCQLHAQAILRLRAQLHVRNARTATTGRTSSVRLSNREPVAETAC
jgi:RNA polymerase sigma factor for flagellar operon FliA